MSEGSPAQAETLAAFLAWPGPSAGHRVKRSAASAALSICAACCVCLVLGALSFAVPLLASGAHSLGLGGHLLLFCHLP